ncbi:MAG TPA: TetR family transcriptional regulator [Holophagaceae bacterium]|nr:TetR family transcriptional regulator [Holophagaceae bacterium]
MVIQVKRARDREQKRERRGDILAEARQLLQERPFAEITMAQVAAKCGLAKGTLYLYFKTKEELFLALMEQESTLWFDAVERGLEAMKGGSNREAVRRLMVEATLAQSDYPRLLGLLHGVLEHNLPTEVAHGFKLEQLRRTERAARALEKRLGFLKPGQGMELLLRFQALVAGLQPMAEPASAMKEILQFPGLEALQVELGSALNGALQAMLMGMEQQAAEGKTIK